MVSLKLLDGILMSVKGLGFEFVREKGVKNCIKKGGNKIGNL